MKPTRLSNNVSELEAGVIVRSAIVCETCGKQHVVRIGMGQETSQSHCFPCRRCGEEIGIGLEVDYINIGHRIVLEKNCSFSEEVSGAEIVNVDANFLIPVDQQGKDFVFPRLSQMQELLKNAEASGANFESVGLDDLALTKRPFRRRDFGAEWVDLRKAWTLHRRGQEILSKGIVKKASSSLYSNAPLSGLPDWVWRFCLQLSSRGGQSRLKAILDKVQSMSDTPAYPMFIKHYRDVMIPARGRIYISILTEYFRSYSEFAQVQFTLAGGIRPSGNDRVSSIGFEQTRMFYGNAFEALASLMDLFALLNNVSQGRNFDQFEHLKLNEYEKIDKSGRANCFASDPDFSAASAEFDNQIRNASHHGGMDFDSSTQTITYRSGKGGAGPSATLSYTEYLVKCVDILMQILLIFETDLVLSQSLGAPAPI